MRIQFACLLLVLLSATVLSEDLDFYQTHVIGQMTGDCDEIMEPFNTGQGECKSKHTFILSKNREKNINIINAICEQDPDGTKLSSKSFFRFVMCTIKKAEKKKGKKVTRRWTLKTTPPPSRCSYRRVNKVALISITCKTGKPYHFDGLVNVPSDYLLFPPGHPLAPQ